MLPLRLMKCQNDDDDDEDDYSVQYSEAHRPQIKDLNGLLTCSLCNGYLVHATALTGCTHTFCRSCIVKYLRKNHYCPACVLLGSNKSVTSISDLRNDELLQRLVYKIVPGLLDDEIKRRSTFSKIYSTDTNQAPVYAAHRDVLSHVKVIYQMNETVNVKLQCSTRVKSGKKQGVKNKSEMPYDNDSATFMSKEACQSYLLCPVSLTIGHLRKYIRFKLGLPESYVIALFCCSQHLFEDFSLKDVVYAFHNKKVKILKLEYLVVCSSPGAGISMVNVQQYQGSSNEIKENEHVPAAVHLTSEAPNENLLCKYLSSNDISKHLENCKHSKIVNKEVINKTSTQPNLVTNFSDCELEISSNTPTQGSENPDSSLVVSNYNTNPNPVNDFPSNLDQNLLVLNSSSSLLNALQASSFLSAYELLSMGYDSCGSVDLLNGSVFSAVEMVNSNISYFNNDSMITSNHDHSFESTMKSVNENLDILSPQQASNLEWLLEQRDILIQDKTLESDNADAAAESFYGDRSYTNESEAEIDRDICNIAANVVIDDENSVTDCEMAEENSPMIQSPFHDSNDSNFDFDDSKLLEKKENVSIVIEELSSETAKDDSSDLSMTVFCSGSCTVVTLPDSLQKIENSEEQSVVNEVNSVESDVEVVQPLTSSDEIVVPVNTDIQNEDEIEGDSIKDVIEEAQIENCSNSKCNSVSEKLERSQSVESDVSNIEDDDDDCEILTELSSISNEIDVQNAAATVNVENSADEKLNTEKLFVIGEEISADPLDRAICKTPVVDSENNLVFQENCISSMSNIDKSNGNDKQSAQVQKVCDSVLKPDLEEHSQNVQIKTASSSIPDTVTTVTDSESNTDREHATINYRSQASVCPMENESETSVEKNKSSFSPAKRIFATKNSPSRISACSESSKRCDGLVSSSLIDSTTFISSRSSVGTQTNIDLVGRYFRRRGDSIGANLFGTKKTSNRDKPVKRVKPKADCRSVTTTTKTKASPTTPISLASSTVLLSCGPVPAPLAPVSIGGKNTLLITIPASYLQANKIPIEAIQESNKVKLENSSNNSLTAVSSVCANPIRPAPLLPSPIIVFSNRMPFFINNGKPMYILSSVAGSSTTQSNISGDTVMSKVNEENSKNSAEIGKVSMPNTVQMIPSFCKSAELYLTNAASASSTTDQVSNLTKVTYTSLRPSATPLQYKSLISPMTGCDALLNALRRNQNGNASIPALSSFIRVESTVDTSGINDKNLNESRDLQNITPIGNIGNVPQFSISQSLDRNTNLAQSSSLVRAILENKPISDLNTIGSGGFLNTNGVISNEKSAILNSEVKAILGRLAMDSRLAAGAPNSTTVNNMWKVPASINGNLVPFNLIPTQNQPAVNPNGISNNFNSNLVDISNMAKLFNIRADVPKDPGTGLPLPSNLVEVANRCTGQNLLATQLSHPFDGLACNPNMNLASEICTVENSVGRASNQSTFGEVGSGKVIRSEITESKTAELMAQNMKDAVARTVEEINKKYCKISIAPPGTASSVVNVRTNEILTGINTSKKVELLPKRSGKRKNGKCNDELAMEGNREEVKSSKVRKSRSAKAKQQKSSTNVVQAVNTDANSTNLLCHSVAPTMKTVPGDATSKISSACTTPATESACNMTTLHSIPQPNRPGSVLTSHAVRFPTGKGVVALPKKVYTFLGLAMSHEHIAAAKNGITQGENSNSNPSGFQGQSDPIIKDKLTNHMEPKGMQCRNNTAVSKNNFTTSLVGTMASSTVPSQTPALCPPSPQPGLIPPSPVSSVSFLPIASHREMAPVVVSTNGLPVSSTVLSPQMDDRGKTSSDDPCSAGSGSFTRYISPSDDYDDFADVVPPIKKLRRMCSGIPYAEENLNNPMSTSFMSPQPFSQAEPAGSPADSSGKKSGKRENSLNALSVIGNGVTGKSVKRKCSDKTLYNGPIKQQKKICP